MAIDVCVIVFVANGLSIVAQSCIEQRRRAWLLTLCVYYALKHRGLSCNMKIGDIAYALYLAMPTYS